ncbi:MAG: hypothetical protein NC311_05210 [Muribaculaceae bacterium]|nr:hypothetical protein [Muribaculaceae bacterium]
MKNFIIGIGVATIAVTPCVHAKTCSEYGVTVGVVCGSGATSVLPPHTACIDKTTCYNTECSTGCYCIPDSSYCPSSGSTTTSCSGKITWGAASSGLEVGLCSNNVTVYRCAQGYYYAIATSGGAPRPPRPGEEYVSREIDCVRCPQMGQTAEDVSGDRPVRPPRPGSTASTNPGAGLYELVQCYIPMNSDVLDDTGVYQFKDENCFYTKVQTDADD